MPGRRRPLGGGTSAGAPQFQHNPQHGQRTDGRNQKEPGREEWEAHMAKCDLEYSLCVAKLGKKKG